MKLTLQEKLYKDEQDAINITNDIREIVDFMGKNADKIKIYVEQMNKWLSGKYISDDEYKGMQYNLRRVIGISSVILRDAKDILDDFTE